MNIKLTTTTDVDNPIEGDLHLEGGDFVWMQDTDEEIAQRIRCRLGMFKGEWFVNPDEGVPYFEEILEKGVNDGRVAAILRGVILGTPGVASLNRFTVERDNENRALTLQFEAVRETGSILRSEEFGDFIVDVDDAQSISEDA
jgi:hypothetical protein